MIKKGSIIFDSQTQKKGVVIRLFPTLDGRKDAIKYRVADGTKEIRTSDAESCREFPYDELTEAEKKAVEIIYQKHLFMKLPELEVSREIAAKLVSGTAANPEMASSEDPREKVSGVKEEVRFWGWQDAPTAGYSNDQVFVEVSPGFNLSVEALKKFWQDGHTINLATDKADRFNDGKRKYSLIDFKALEGMVEVLEAGARKYSPDNWKKGLPTNEIFESMMRHLVELQAGNELDEETGLHHTGHVLCNAMILAYMYQSKREFISWNT